MTDTEKRTRRKRTMSMIGTKGYFLKIIAMSGAIDLEGIRIFYQTHNGRRVKDKNMKILRENGYIQKAVFRRKAIIISLKKERYCTGRRGQEYLGLLGISDRKCCHKHNAVIIQRQ